MISGAITTLRPTAPGVAPGTALPAGPAGPSAYQAALDNGFVGTQAQWLESLVGPVGATGPQGATGSTGPQGNPATVNGKSGASITLAASDVGAATPTQSLLNALIFG